MIFSKKNVQTIVFVLILMMLGNQALTAQGFSYGFPVASGEVTTGDGSVSFSYGLPFCRQLSNGFSISEGVQHAQMLSPVIVYDTTCEAEMYQYVAGTVPLIYPIPATGPFKARVDTTLSRYVAGGSKLHYDTLTVLRLCVHDTAITYDTVLMYADRAALDHLVPGGNTQSLSTIYGCDSTVYKYVYTLTCNADYETDALRPGVKTQSVKLDTPLVQPKPFVSPVNIALDRSNPYDYPVGDDRSTDVVWTIDIPRKPALTCTQNVLIHYFNCSTVSPVVFDGFSYDIIRLGVNCWTKQNLRPRHYADGTDIPAPMAYQNASENIDTYGYLYSWKDATRNGAQVAGLVQGICPDGWHIPTADIYADILAEYEGTPLMANSYLWIPEGGTDTYGFSAIPAGIYNHAQNRYEDLRVRNDLWSCSNAGYTAIYTACEFGSFCRTIELVPLHEKTGASVRCIMN